MAGAGEGAYHVRYLAVARVPDRVCVASHMADTSENSGVLRTLYSQKLAKVLSSGRVEEHRRLTITDADVGSIHYDSDAICLYVAITSTSYPQRTAFQMLYELQTKFENEFGDRFGLAKEGELNKPAKSLLQECVNKYEHIEKVDRVAHVALQVDEVKGAMQNNINAVLKNQDNLESLLSASEIMRGDASAFSRTATRTKSRMCWRNARRCLVIVGILVALGAAIAAVVIINRPASQIKSGGATGGGK